MARDNSGIGGPVLPRSMELQVSLVRWFKWVREMLRGAPKFSLLYLTAAVIAAIFASQLAPYDPVRGNLADMLQPPSLSSGHLLGTDHVGRDLLSRLIYGARISVTVGFLAVFVSGTIGTTIGVLTGLLKGRTDAILMQLTDGFLSLPFLMIAVTAIAIVGPSLWSVILIIGLLRWMNYARIVRSEALRISERDYVRLATVVGASKLHIIVRHLFPNLFNSLLVIGTVELGTAVMFESALSFLGLGVPRPLSSWGTMLAESQIYMYTSWWLPVLPGIAIFLLIMSTNLTGDWLRERTDPTRRQL